MEQSGNHTVEECEKLTGLRKEAEREMKEWQTRHLRGREKGKGGVGVEKEKEKEEQEWEKMVCLIYEFLTDPEK